MPLALPCEDAAGREIDRAGQHPGDDDRRQQQHQRGAKEKKQVDAAPADRLGVGLVGDERVGRKGQRLVEQEQREQVLGEGDADGAAQCHGEAHIVGRLPWLVVAAHVADGVDRVHDPEDGRDQRKKHSERLDLECEREPRHHLDVQRFGAGARKYGTEQAQHRQEQRAGRRKRDRFAQIWRAMEDRDQQRADKRDQDGGENQRLGRIGEDHLSPPMSACAALLAMPADHSVKTPK